MRLASTRIGWQPSLRCRFRTPRPRRTNWNTALKQCGAVGGVIAANVDGSNLGEAPLDEFWSAAVDLAVPIFIHPTQPTPLPRTRNYGLNQIVQYTYDTTASVGLLIFSGVLDRFPELTLILSHGGGYFPYQAGRFDRVYRDLKAPTAPSQPPSAYLRRFFDDTSCTILSRSAICAIWWAVTAYCSAPIIPSPWTIARP